MAFLRQRGLWLFVGVLLCDRAAAQTNYEFGFAKADITPESALRLSGYGSRTQPADGVDARLFVRAMAMQAREEPLHVIISVDTIGFHGSLTKSIVKRITQQHDISRECIVISCTHSHTAPHIAGELTNIFTVPLSEQQSRDAAAYTKRVSNQVLAAVERAVADLQPGRLFAAEGRVGFARNRRLVVDGRYAGFGIQADGQTDHTLPLLCIQDDQGKLRGLVYNYACHCTTFPGGYNRVNGDWAGYASQKLEEMYPGVTALCTIGCGADQNPQPDESRPPIELAQLYGRDIAVEVQRLVSGEMRPITAKITSSFGYAGLPFDRPSVDELKQALNDRQPQVRRHANNMLAILERMDRLPETYPAPIHVWRFGDQLCMVLLGGEVVVDYASRLKQEIDSGQVWVSAYCDDVFGYVASERVRQEGGYEVSASMIYYNQPGPWAEGTEDVLVRRIHELVEQGSFAGPFTPTEALETFRLAPGFQIGIVAAEPLVADPIYFAVGADRRLWVVEMGDYPLGQDGKGAPGGRVRLLADVDGDGTYDQSTTFLDQVSFPNGIFPWNDGVLVSCGGQIVFAKDSDGDDRADKITTLVSGFSEDNPQHRMAGFTYGLDNWLYVSAGHQNREVHSVLTGNTVDVGRQDFRIQPDRGFVEVVGGQTQYGRNRDDWGNWFGGDNSRPIWHYLIDDRYLRRNPFVALPELKTVLLSPEFAPQVFPASRTLDRFNDLFAENRFTSACSPMIFRDTSLGQDVQGAAFICEPVHNLVHRAVLVEDGVTYKALRHADDSASEFVASTDHWFRPTMATTGPDGALWIADMQRAVIEHPQWIPEPWQAELDLRAGDRLGRIYRVYRTGDAVDAMPDLAVRTSLELIRELEHANGWRRDTAQRLLVERGDRSVTAQLGALLANNENPIAKVHALSTLAGLGALTPEHLKTALADRDNRVERHAILLSEQLLEHDQGLQRQLLQLTGHEDKRVRLQLALTFGELERPDAAGALMDLALADVDDPVMRAAILSSSVAHADSMLAAVLRRAPISSGRNDLVKDLISTALGVGNIDDFGRVLEVITADEGPQPWQFDALARLDQALMRRNLGWDEFPKDDVGNLQESLARAATIVAAAHRVTTDTRESVEHRLAALSLLGRGFTRTSEDLATLASLVSPRQPVELQIGAVQSLSRIRDERIPHWLLGNWKELSPSVQSEVLLVLLSRPTWHESLIAAMENDHVHVQDLDAATRMRLASCDIVDLRDRARKILGENDAEHANLETLIRQVDGLEGDPSRGAAGFQAKCAACHRHNQIGQDFGPTLAALTDKSTLNLLKSVLEPSQAIEKRYTSHTCITTDGRVLNGMIVSESSSSISLALPNGTQQVVLRVDIDELENDGVSFMPTGLGDGLGPQGFADLLAFIRNRDVVEDK